MYSSNPLVYVFDWLCICVCTYLCLCICVFNVVYLFMWLLTCLSIYYAPAVLAQQKLNKWTVVASTYHKKEHLDDVPDLRSTFRILLKLGAECARGAPRSTGQTQSKPEGLPDSIMIPLGQDQCPEMFSWQSQLQRVCDP